MATIKINDLIFTKINGTSKRGQHIINSYHNSTAYRLSDVYNSYSDAKERAFNYCLHVMRAVNGSCPWITGANCHSFSFAFVTKSDDGKHYLIYITRSGDYAVALDDTLRGF